MKVKIDLKKGQTPEQAEEELYKALNIHRSGEVHGEEFVDPLMEKLSQEVIKSHKKLLDDMYSEIFELIDKDVK